MFFCALLDACCLPLPTPMFFISLVLINRSNAYKYAIYAAIGAFLGALIGYAIGYFAWIKSNGDFTKLALFLFEYVPGFSVEAYAAIKVEFDKWDFWILAIASFLPIPYKIFSISSGVFHINFIAFSITTLVSKILTFYGFAYLTRTIGERVKHLFKFSRKPVALILVIAVAGIIIFRNLN